MLFLVPVQTQSRNEELSNGISHGLGFIAAIIGTPILTIQAIHKGNTSFLVGTIVFCSMVLLLYLASAIYHLLSHGRAKSLFYIFDTVAIFLLIAGSYTPFSIGIFRGALGWSFFGITWGIATIGIMFKIIYGTRHPIFSTVLYLIMGWIIIFAIKQLIAIVPIKCVYWLVAGGVFYTVGVVFFVLDSRLRFSHFIWHLFVMTGTTCHYIAIWFAANQPQ